MIYWHVNANWKSIEVVADVDAEKRIEDSSDKIFKPEFGQYLAADVFRGYKVESWSRFWS